MLYGKRLDIVTRWPLYPVLAKPTSWSLKAMRKPSFKLRFNWAGGHPDEPDEPLNIKIELRKSKGVCKYPGSILGPSRVPPGAPITPGTTGSYRNSAYVFTIDSLFFPTLQCSGYFLSS